MWLTTSRLGTSKVLGVKHNRVNYSNQVFNTTYVKVCCKNKTQQKMVKLFFKTMLLTFLTFFFVFGFMIGNFNPFSNDWSFDSRFVLIITTILFGVVIFGINAEINDDN